jgi:hypothetical protein
LNKQITTLASLENMTIGQLRQKYLEVFDDSTNSRNKPWLRRRILWRMQANNEGTLSERAQARAAELADESYLGGKLPEPRRVKERDARLPSPGTILIRPYRDTDIRVSVLEDGFKYKGQHFQSLTGIAKEVTGSHWNGFAFFGLSKKKEKQV